MISEMEYDRSVDIPIETPLVLTLHSKLTDAVELPDVVVGP